MKCTATGSRDTPTTHIITDATLWQQSREINSEKELRMKKDSKKNNTAAIIVVFAVIIIAFLSENMPAVRKFISSINFNAVLVVLALIVFFGSILTALIVASKKYRETPASLRAREHELKAHTDSKEAIKCTCAKGKQRYLDQADMFLKNGLIDKNEWKTMRERYNKLDIPEEM